MNNFPAEPLQKTVTQIFTQAGASADNAHTVAKHLVESSLAGHDSHGVMRVGQYCQAIKDGQVRPAATPSTISQRGAVLMLDGRYVFGQVAGHTAMDVAMEMSAEHGIASVTVRSCYHSGRLGAYAQQAAEHGRIGLVMVNAGGGGQWVAPFGGCAPRLSTNPIAMGAPTGGDFPIVLDFATCMAPEGKIRNYKRRGDTLPDGWIVSGNGTPSTDPNDLYADPPGAILPMGGSVGYKGFALAVMVDILAGSLSGAGCCHAEEVPPQDGIVMIAINPELYTGADFARQEIAGLVAHAKSCPTLDNVDEVFAPGELEYRLTLKRRAQGVPLDESTAGELETLAKQFGVEPCAPC